MSFARLMPGHTAVYFLARIGNGLIGLAALYLLTRQLTPSGYGAYTLGVAAVNVVTAICFQWLNVGVGRFWRVHESAPAALMLPALKLFTSISLVLMFVVLACLLLHERLGVSEVWLLAVGAGALTMGLHGLYVQVANANGEPLRYSALTFVRAATALGASVLLVAAGQGADAAVAGMAAGAVVAVLVCGRLHLRQAAKGSTLDADADVRSQLLTYGMPLVVVYICAMLLDMADRFMIAWWYGTARVAGYAAAYDLAQQTIAAVLNVFYLAAYPRVIAAWEAAGTAGVRPVVESLGHRLLLAAPLGAGIFTGLAPEVAHLMFGPALRDEAARIIPWVAVGVAVSGIRSYLLDVAFQVRRTTHLQLRVMAAIAVLNLALNLVAIPLFGTVGAAAALAVSACAGAMLTWWIGRSADIYPALARPLIIVSSAALAAVLVLRATAVLPDATTAPLTLARLALGTAVYGAVVFLADMGGIRSRWSARGRATR